MFFKTNAMAQKLHRRDWLKQSSLALAGLSLIPAHSAFAGSPVNRITNGVADGPIRLTSNENPYGPSPLARKAMADAVALSNRYPWDTTTRLRETIGAAEGLTKDHVIMGAGSSEILGLAAQLAALEKGQAITAAPSFSIWVRAAERMGLEIVRVPLTADKKHDLKAMLSRLSSSTRLFYICNPNNPTGTLLPSQEVRAAVEQASQKALVVLDEAYLEYSSEPSLAKMVQDNRNLVVVRTFSKIYGLAGARIGYALAHPDTIQMLNGFQPWTNAGASTVSLAAAMASLQDKEFVSFARQKNREAGDYTARELKALGFTVIPTSTNFLYYSLGGFKGNWQELLSARNILTGRTVEEQGQWTRTTIGTPEEMKMFIAAAKGIV